jgi:pimeloyl-ACP methyl ester carboxylesterase
MKAYLLSGLGCDKRAYCRLKFPEGIEPVHVDWLTPFPGERLNAYVDRLILQLDTSTPFYLIGLSFGGMIACMMAEKIKPVKTIIISSIANRDELPPVMKFMGVSGLYKLIPNRKLKSSNPVMNKLFGVKDDESRSLLNEIVKDTEPAFIRWAVGSIVQWEQTQCCLEPVRIHGMDDRILPPKKFKPHYRISNSGHFVVFDSAEEVSAILREICQ